MWLRLNDRELKRRLKLAEAVIESLEVERQQRRVVERTGSMQMDVYLWSIHETDKALEAYRNATK